MVLNYKGKHVIHNWTDINYLQYVLCRWGFRTPSMLRAGYPTLLHWRGRYNLSNPTPLEGEVRFVQPYPIGGGGTICPGSKPRSPKIIVECLLTHSMLIKMYVHAFYSWFCIWTILSNRKHEYGSLTKINWHKMLIIFSLGFAFSIYPTIPSKFVTIWLHYIL